MTTRSLISVSLVAWSALCALIARIHFPHFLVICESVEALYGNMADDMVVSRVMRELIGFLWMVGSLAIVVCITLARRPQRASSRAPSP
ncbi:hypothetical protein KDX23_22725 [Burkholderia vietnamiensis]|uniref:hypothetical protein n=1 Tax=Burkholderia vietnamiensis TaxID=60552 RepID=UPI001B939F14|nr:hypothetical protein [Burkholderia vietnamiensis]MBR8085553.1 hypothetical protein [Burkholderia vietnamiensis]